MTIKIDRSHVCKLMIACSSVYNSLMKEALDPDTNPDRKEKAYDSAGMWERIHDELKEQLDAFDKKEAERRAKK